MSTHRTKPPTPAPPSDVDAFSISEFCRRHGFSSQLFYKLRARGGMPETFCVGKRVLISRESAEQWRRERAAEHIA